METPKPKRKVVKVQLEIPVAEARRWRAIAGRVGATLTSYMRAVVRAHFRDIENDQKEAKP